MRKLTLCLPPPAAALYLVHKLIDAGGPRYTLARLLLARCGLPDTITESVGSQQSGAADRLLGILVLLLSFPPLLRSQTSC